ncbi:MAG: hypothetical protein Q9168_005471 [Polycauliona sp. 1 TL-2023]
MTKSPSGIPAYASACTNSAAYSSACSCLGVRPTTTTVAAPLTTTTRTDTVTATQTATATQVIPTTLSTFTTLTATVATVTAACAAAQPTFYLQAAGSSFDGQYAHVVPSGNGADDSIVFTNTQSSASLFTINSLGQLTTGNDIANSDGGSAASFFYFDTTGAIANSGFVAATCSIANALTSTPSLTCVDQGATVFQLCQGQPYSGDGVALVAANFQGCSGLGFNVVCVN